MLQNVTLLSRRCVHTFFEISLGAGIAKSCTNMSHIILHNILYGDEIFILILKVGGNWKICWLENISWQFSYSILRWKWHALSLIKFIHGQYWPIYKGYSIFKSALGGGGALNFFGGYLPPQFNFVDPPLPVHFKFNITLRNTLCHPLLSHFDLFNTSYTRITNNFQVHPPLPPPPPPPGNFWKWNSP